jgi:DNA-binding NarL/FixJ family response regulator
MLVEDEPLYRHMLSVALAQYPQFEVVGDFGGTDEALGAASKLDPQVAVLDIELPGTTNGVQLGLALRQLMPSLGVLLLSNHSDPAFLSAVPRGSIAGWSFLQKKSVRNLDALVRAIEGAAMGLVVLDEELVSGRGAARSEVIARLSARQREVLALIAQGYTNAAIADQLVLSEKSVENYTNQIYQQLKIGGADTSMHPRVTAALLYVDGSSAGAGSGIDTSNRVP